MSEREFKECSFYPNSPFASPSSQQNKSFKIKDNL